MQLNWACGGTTVLARIKMPLLRIVTNVERKDIPDNFLEEATDVLAQAIGKPREVGLHAPCGASRQGLHSMGYSNNVIECTLQLMQQGRLRTVNTVRARRIFAFSQRAESAKHSRSRRSGNILRSLFNDA